MRTTVSALILLATQVLGQMPPAPVTVARVVEEDVAAGRTLIGTVEALRSALVESEVDGLVSSVSADEGHLILAGRPMASLSTTQLAIAIRAAEAELTLRQKALLELTNGTRPEEIEIARARYAAAEANLPYRRWRLSQTESLRVQTNEDDRRTARLGVDLAEQELREARAELDLALAGVRSEAIAQATARVAAQQAEVDRLVDLRERHTIRAPFTGYVVAKHTEKGQWLKTGDAAFGVAQLDTVEVVVPVPEEDIARVVPGAEVSLRVDAFPARVFHGTVAAIVPAADRLSRTFPVRIRLANGWNADVPMLLDGMLAKVDLPLGRPRAALLVPKDALVLGGRTVAVFAVEESDKGAIVKLVPVMTGIAVGDWIAIEGPLEIGQKVVVHGNERLRPDQAVAILRELPRHEKSEERRP